MLSPSYVHTSAADADAAPQALFVERGTADQEITDTFAARSFSQQLRVARRAALNEPATAAQLLSIWMSNNG